MYYLRTKPAASAIQFTVDKKKLKQRTQSSASPASSEKKSKEGDEVRQVEENMAAMVCSLANKDDCLMCGS